MSDENPERFADDAGNPVAREGLRSLRAEKAPESSMKATLAALRAAGEPPESPGRGPLTFVAWMVAGAVVAAVVAYFLFFR